MVLPKRSFVNFNERALWSFVIIALYSARKAAHGTIRQGGGMVISTKLWELLAKNLPDYIGLQKFVNL